MSPYFCSPLESRADLGIDRQIRTFDELPFLFRKEEVEVEDRNEERMGNMEKEEKNNAWTWMFLFFVSASRISMVSSEFLKLKTFILDGKL